ncbi:MAG: phosphatidate cytidylyltransferase [Oscillospiraceae bacterium]|nr:phosphatidate cytidylyltransferase [Oscillospiraceae bacterium]
MKTRVLSAIVMFAILGVCVFVSPITRVLLIAFCAILSIIEMWNALRRMRIKLETIPLVAYVVLHMLFCLFEAQAPLLISLYGFIVLLTLCICIVRNEAKSAIGTLFVLNYPLLLYAFITWILLQKDWQLPVATAAFGTWLCDSFALFGGKLLGKHKLCPKVSPNKTIEGSICGALFSLLGGVAAWYLLKGSMAVSLAEAMVTALIASTMGQFGDLAASLIKRAAGLKDYSKIIPGHGGMMDRADSLLFAIPTGWFCYHIFSLFR